MTGSRRLRGRGWAAWVALLVLGAVSTAAVTAYAANISLTSQTLTSRTVAPPCLPAWWNNAYSHRVPLSVTTGSNSVGTDYSVAATLDHASWVAAGNALASGDDVRVVALNSSTCAWTELDRVVADSSAWNTSSTRVWFRLTATITANSSSSQAFFVYYGNPAAGAPPANHGNVFLAYDRFPGTSLGAAWQVLRPPTTWSVGGDALNITMGTNQDFWGGGGNAPLFSVAAPTGSFEVQVRQSGALTAGGQTAGVLAYTDDDNYVANYHEWFTGGGKGTEFVRETAGSPVSQTNTSGAATADPMWLRLGKVGSTYTASYSTNGGASYSTQGTYSYSLGLNRVGLSAFSYSSNSTSVSFTNFRIRRLVNNEPTVTVGAPTAKY